MQIRNPLAYRALRMLALLATVSIVATACDDDDPVGEQEPNTQRVVLTIGTGATAQTITWTTANATVSPNTITIPRGESRTVTAQFLRSDGTPDPVINATDFRLDFAVTGTGITVTKNGNLGATITAGNAAAQPTIIMKVVHLDEGHDEYVSTAVTVNVP